MAPYLWIVLWIVLVAVRLRALTHDCYHHVQEVIRADAHAGQRTIHAKERIFRRGDPTGSLYQPTAVTPVNPFRHVMLLPTPLFVVLPFRRFLHGVVIHWTPLVRYPTAEWFEELTDAVAHFLGLGRDEVELADTNIIRKRARIVRASS